jgi:hypothetical protein
MVTIPTIPRKIGGKNDIVEKPHENALKLQLCGVFRFSPS